MMGPSTLPLVITVSKPAGYEGGFIHYSKEELYSIVKDSKDISLPEVSEEMKSLGIVTEKANTELVEKGRTMTIDQALRGRAPRTWSVDSIDYTSLVTGDLGEEGENLRKRRRHQKKKHSLGVCFVHISFGYSLIFEFLDFCVALYHGFGRNRMHEVRSREMDQGHSN